MELEKYYGNGKKMKLTRDYDYKALVNLTLLTKTKDEELVEHNEEESSISPGE